LILVVVAADRAAARLAEPHAVRIAVTNGLLHGLCVQRGIVREPRSDEPPERRLHAVQTEAAVAIAKYDGSWRLYSAVLTEVFVSPLLLPL
jgi:hypothetical protein